MSAQRPDKQAEMVTHHVRQLPMPVTRLANEELELNLPVPVQHNSSVLLYRRLRLLLG
jgi:RNA-splicing ligase RtcB